MENFISIFILIPLIGLFINAIISEKEEVKLSQVSVITMGIQLICVLFYTAIWIYQGAPTLYHKDLSLMQFHNFELYIDFTYNLTTAVFLLVGAFISFLISTYSRKYLHREPDFKRFFTTIMLFYIGYNLIVLSGNLTSIFIGWEIAGLSSFLLIAYYRDRYIPVKNALKIFSIYRLGDICILLAMWISHNIWHENITLESFTDPIMAIEIIKQHKILSGLFALSVFTAAAIKSAQFPFSAWLSRAMEGPTPSSAIFYSSLAAHLGLLILIRTHDFWINVPYMQELTITMGLLSFIIASFTARIQPSIKGQIAYQIVGQIGIMFIEVALGLHLLVLIHFSSHAMLRSYQLLISPSIISYKIKKQFFEFKPVKRIEMHPVFQRIHNSVYILSLHEWYLDGFMFHLIWSPLKKAGQRLQKIPYSIIKWSSYLMLCLSPIVILLVETENCPSGCVAAIKYLFLCMSLIYILRIFTERNQVWHAWYKIGFFHLFILMAMYLNGGESLYLTLYAIGIVISLGIGHYAITNIVKTEGFFDIKGYNGHYYEHPFMEFLFLISCLGLMGFPITSSFLGIELILNSVDLNHIPMLVMLLLAFLINGLAMIRLYARIFLGPHIKTYHSKANRSA